MRTNPGGRGAGEGDTLIDDLRKSVRPPAVVFAFEAVPALYSEISMFSKTCVVFFTRMFQEWAWKICARTSRVLPEIQPDTFCRC